MCAQAAAHIRWCHRKAREAQHEAGQQLIQKQLQAVHEAAASGQAKAEQQLSSQRQEQDADAARMGTQLADLTKQQCAAQPERCWRVCLVLKLTTTHSAA